jgi:hypothetical protein
LENVEQALTAMLNKPVSAAAQTAFRFKNALRHRQLLGTVSGIDKTMVGLECGQYQRCKRNKQFHRCATLLLI